MNKDIEVLSEALKEVMLPVCKEWNTVSLPMMEKLYRGRSFKSIFEGRQTQEKTKTVSPILDEIVAEFIKDKISNFTITEGKGFDYTLNDTEIEWKNSLSDSNSWTGNGYNKTNWHVLCKFILNEDGVIEKYFACIVPYDMVDSNWSETGNSNFSSLSILKTDLDYVIEVSGSFKPSVKYLKPEYVSLA
tara:strand:- start:66 stop:632 length:567 start_codon:yes stop_codon:yes gene_type:complete